MNTTSTDSSSSLRDQHRRSQQVPSKHMYLHQEPMLLLLIKIERHQKCSLGRGISASAQAVARCLSSPKRPSRTLAVRAASCCERRKPNRWSTRRRARSQCSCVNCVCPTRSTNWKNWPRRLRSSPCAPSATRPTRSLSPCQRTPLDNIQVFVQSVPLKLMRRKSILALNATSNSQNGCSPSH